MKAWHRPQGGGGCAARCQHAVFPSRPQAAEWRAKYGGKDSDVVLPTKVQLLPEDRERMLGRGQIAGASRRSLPPRLTQLFSTTACAATEADFKRLEKLVEEQRQLVRVKVEGGECRRVRL